MNRPRRAPSEVHSKLVALGWGSDRAWRDSTGIVDQVVPFTGEQAKRAGDLVSLTRFLGLSLGDRACLALALGGCRCLHHRSVLEAFENWISELS